MSIAPDNARRDPHHRYRAMREFLEPMDDTLPGKFEITKEGIVHDMMSPGGPHEVTAAHISHAAGEGDAGRAPGPQRHARCGE